MTIQLKYDSRDQIHSQKFGEIFEFPDELNFDTPLVDEIQPIGDVKCTCYTTCDIAEDQENIEFDIDDLWQRVPQSKDGADPRDVLGEAVKNGLLPKGNSFRKKDWRSYWRADLGNMDAFDNVRSALMMTRSPIGCGTFWYREWLNSPILPLGKNPAGGHMYSIEGWREVEGKPHFIIEAWLGHKLYMSREVFNEALKPWGMQTWVLSTASIDAKRSKSLIEMIKDLSINLIIKLRDLIKEKKVEPVVPEPIVKVETETKKPGYMWDNPVFARHSVRMICDEEGLTVDQKNTLCATIACESNFNWRAINYNKVNGQVVSTDRGICQWNDYYHHKEISADEAINNPEKAVRLMCDYWKKGKENQWVCHSSGRFAKFL